jgi:hypothetical protein
LTYPAVFCTERHQCGSLKMTVVSPHSPLYLEETIE